MLDPSANSELPPIPAKRYFTIGEVSEALRGQAARAAVLGAGVPYPEADQAPGNRRYYQRQDVILIRQIRSLLWEHEYTIAGARQKLASGETKRDSEQSRQIVRQVRIELEDILAILRH